MKTIGALSMATVPEPFKVARHEFLPLGQGLLRAGQTNGRLWRPHVFTAQQRHRLRPATLAVAHVATRLQAGVAHLLDQVIDTAVFSGGGRVTAFVSVGCEDSYILGQPLRRNRRYERLRERC
jgi:hypothetical protein